MFPSVRMPSVGIKTDRQDDEINILSTGARVAVTAEAEIISLCITVSINNSNDFDAIDAVEFVYCTRSNFVLSDMTAGTKLSGTLYRCRHLCAAIGDGGLGGNRSRHLRAETLAGRPPCPPGGKKFRVVGRRRG